MPVIGEPKTLYKFSVKLTTEGYVWASSQKEALAILYHERKRLTEERGDLIIDVLDQLQNVNWREYEEGYQPYGTDNTLLWCVKNEGKKC